jgi:periplasmic mercuric ion binding protein
MAAMSRILSATVWCITLFASVAATAAGRTVTLAVDGMTCASCPYIVRTVLLRRPVIIMAAG